MEDRPESRPLTGISLLVIDDDPAVRRILGRQLVCEGARAVCAAGAAQGLDLARTQEFDLVILDVCLPQAAPGRTVAELKHAAPGRPILLITGGADPARIAEAKQAGAAGPLQKPIEIHALVDAVLRSAAADAG